MNPNEIKKALECCIKGKTRGDCEKLRCPAYRKEGCAYFLKSNSLYDEDAVHREMCKDALAYINQLEAEVEKHKEFPIHTLSSSALICTRTSDEYDKLIADIGNEAIKEFAERLKANSVTVKIGEQNCRVITVDGIDYLLK